MAWRPGNDGKGVELARVGKEEGVQGLSKVLIGQGGEKNRRPCLWPWGDGSRIPKEWGQDEKKLARINGGNNPKCSGA
jgi:hypothetical protein